eukprot:scaffold2421_cov390-Prasinococcus_capsulatus_cf.AAC.2
MATRVCIQKGRIEDKLAAADARQYEILLPQHCPSHKQPTKRNRSIKRHQRFSKDGKIKPNPSFFHTSGPDREMEHVTELTVTNFNESMEIFVRHISCMDGSWVVTLLVCLLQVHERQSNVLVFYYAPFCEFSEEAAPEFETLAQELQDTPIANTPIELVKVNAHDQAPIYLWEGLEGYPILMLYTPDGRKVRHYRAKTAAKLRTFLETAAASSGIIHLNQAELAAALATNNYKKAFDQVIAEHALMSDRIVDTPLLLVQFQSTWCAGSAALANTVREVAQAMENQTVSAPDPRKVSIAFVDADREQEILEQYGVAKYPLMKLFHLCEGREESARGITVRQSVFDVFDAATETESGLQFEPQTRDASSITDFLVQQQGDIDKHCRGASSSLAASGLVHDEL